MTDPRTLGAYPVIEVPAAFAVDDSMIIPPAPDPSLVTIRRGPNIKPLPTRGPMEDMLDITVLIRLGDNVTTDDIMPAGSKILPLRSNIEAISRHVFSGIDPAFSQRALQTRSGCIVAGSNYGQGSSREHAALAPMYLGVKIVFALSFARIHRSNLINFGIIPVTVDDPGYAALSEGTRVSVRNIHAALDRGSPLDVAILDTGEPVACTLDLTAREATLLKEGGLLNHIRSTARSI